MNCISRISAGVTSSSSDLPTASAPPGGADHAGSAIAAMAIRNITNAAILHRPMAALRDAASKSLRAVRIKKRPSIVCIGDVSRQDKAKFCQGFEFLELSLNQDLRD